MKIIRKPTGNLRKSKGKHEETKGKSKGIFKEIIRIFGEIMSKSCGNQAEIITKPRTHYEEIIRKPIRKARGNHEEIMMKS